MYKFINVLLFLLLAVFFLLFCFLFFAMIGFAENVNITGVVTSAEDGEPLIGASVQVKGNPSQGVATDIDGNYTISVPAGATL